MASNGGRVTIRTEMAVGVQRPMNGRQWLGALLCLTALAVLHGCGNGDGTHETPADAVADTADGGAADAAVDGGGGQDGGPQDGGGQDGGGQDGGGQDGGAQGGADAGASFPGTPDDPGPFTWPQVGAPAPSSVPATLGKHEVGFPWDMFMVSPEGMNDLPTLPRWLKFTIHLGAAELPWFQNGGKLKLHHAFASAHLAPFQGMSPTAFDAVTLHEDGQQAVLGVVLTPQQPGVHEVGIQIVRHDPLHPAMVRKIADVVLAAIKPSQPGVTLKAFYMPTAEQRAAAWFYAPWYAAHDLPVAEADRWAPGAACYAHGWAVGKLVQVDGAGIDAAWSSGQLGPGDILLTDLVPAEVPPVAGIVATHAATPSSHVAILAADQGTPFVRLVGQDLALAKGLVGKTIVLRAAGDPASGGCNVRLFDAGQPSAATLDKLHAMKLPPKLTHPKIKPAGVLVAPIGQLGAQPVASFGGKAAGMALLSATVPDFAPKAFAISFDLWLAFMKQPSGADPQPLGERIAKRIAPLQGWPPTDVQAMQAALAEVRGWIEAGVFTEEQRKAVIAALAPLDPKKRIRFRSSTNVEDGLAFTGAGLYDSASGCLADDTDSDDAGPSHCDPTKASERGAFRAIAKVFASFYGDNAFAERRRRQVDESTVGMALLVHHAFPDDDEWANGVAQAFTMYGDTRKVTMVSQKGAVSVSNPSDDSLPEQVKLAVYAKGDASATVVQHSSLLPIGATVLAWPEDYKALAAAFAKVLSAWLDAHPGVKGFGLDFEYKKMAPGKLIIKQARPLAVQNLGEPPTPFLLGAARTLCVYQGEQGTDDVFAAHRLKSIWTLTPKATSLDAAGLAQPIFSEVSVQWMQGSKKANLQGDPGGFAKAAHGVATSWVGTTDSWQVQTPDGPQKWTLLANLGGVVNAASGPLVDLDDLWMRVEVEHPKPVSYTVWGEPAAQRTVDRVQLGPCPSQDNLSALHMAQTRDFSAGGWSAKLKYWWPPAPMGSVGGYTAPLVAFEQATLSGILDAPIVLKDYWSVSHRPEHHNFGETWIFEPGRATDIDPKVAIALKDKGIAAIYVRGSNYPEVPITFWTVGLDGKLTVVAPPP